MADDVTSRLRDLSLSPSSPTLTVSERSSPGYHSPADVTTSRQTEQLLRKIEEAHQVFVETEGFKHARDFLIDGHRLILLDAPGCGKTTTSLILMRKYLKKKYCCHFVDSIENFDVVDKIDLHKSNILVFDDFLGKSGLSAFEKWNRVLKELDVMFNKQNNTRPQRQRHGLSMEECENVNSERDKADIKVIFTSRNYLFKMAQPLLGEYKHTIMKMANVVDLSQWRLTEAERKAMLSKHSRIAGVTLVDEVIQAIVSHTENSIGFPYSCKMFLKNKWFQKHPEQFFSKPFVYLKDHLQQLLGSGETPGQASALVLVALLDGKMKIADLNPRTRKLPDIEKYLNYLDDVDMTKKPGNIIAGAESLKGSYLEVEDKSYVFAHATVYDAVASIMGEKDPNFVLQYCTMTFIHDYVQLENSASRADTSDYDCSVTIPGIHSPIFVRRFADEISACNFCQVFRHGVFEQDDFVDDLFEELGEDSILPEVLHKTDTTHGQCLLFWSMFSSSPFVVQKLFKHTVFQDHELLEGFLGCVINGNTRSLDILIKHSESSSVLDLVKSATIGDILQNETNTGKLMNKLTKDQDDGSSSKIPFPGDENDGLLHLACIRSHKDVVERLLKLGCAVNALGQLGRTPLMYASRGGDHEVADILLKVGADINIMDEEGACALHLAARGGHLHVMKIFLENGVNINEKGEHGRTPLLYACRYGYPEFVKFCLENGGDTSLKCNADSCLHLACISGNLEVVKMLLDKGMAINEPGQFGRTPIMYACRHGHLDIVNHMRLKGGDLKVVDDRGEDIFYLSVFGGNVDLAKEMLPPDATLESVCDSQRRSPFENASAMGHYDMLKYFIDNKKELVPVPFCLIAACYNGHMTLVKMLIDIVDNINVKGENGRTALISACFGGQTETAEFLISKKADVRLVDDYDISCWQHACDTGKVDLVKLLLKQGFTVNTPCQNGMTSLMCACRRNHQDLFEFLVEYDRNMVHTLDTFGLTCLHHSCIGKHDNPQILEMLFDRGMNNVNCRDNNGKTPAMYASKNGLTNILHCLVEHGADLNLKDKNGQTCLHYACFSKNEDTIRYLGDCGVYINCEDNKKTTPLMTACFRGNPVAVDVLLELGADATKLNIYTEACVHTACREGHVQVVEVLVRHGVDMEMKGKFGRTPFMYACRYGKSDVVDYLREVSVRVLAADENGASSLHLCCMGNIDDCSVASKLTEFGINVNCKDDGLKTPAMYASKNGLTNILHCLVEHGADLNLNDKNGQTCLHYACFSKNEDTIGYLGDCGVYINCEDNKKTTPLMTACFRGNPVAVDVLLELGADATKLNIYTEACVHTACREGHVQVVEVLVRHGVDMEMKGKFGRTPFMYACQYGKCDVVDYLREVSVRVLAADENGANSLHLCCMGKNNDCSIPRKLLQFGIDVNSRDNNGMTPIMQSSSRGNCLLFDFLYSKGANIAFQDRQGKTCYDFALKGGHDELAEKIRHLR